MTLLACPRFNYKVAQLSWQQIFAQPARAHQEAGGNARARLTDNLPFSQQFYRLSMRFALAPFPTRATEQRAARRPTGELRLAAGSRGRATISCAFNFAEPRPSRPGPCPVPTYPLAGAGGPANRAPGHNYALELKRSRTLA